jgi:hypothetical protein
MQLAAWLPEIPGLKAASNRLSVPYEELRQIVASGMAGPIGHRHSAFDESYGAKLAIDLVSPHRTQKCVM